VRPEAPLQDHYFFGGFFAASMIACSVGIQLWAIGASPRQAVRCVASTFARKAPARSQ
jgi:hypothetical protein